jgi:predicted RNA-binding protein YlxR (DUF448 family)
LRVRHVPLRECSICGERRPKRELLRVVRTPHGEVAVDETGRQNGRGAYVCLRPACLREASRGQGLAKRLEVDIPAPVREDLERRAQAGLGA